MTERDNITIDELNESTLLVNDNLFIVRKGTEDFKMTAATTATYMAGSANYDTLTALLADAANLTVGKKYATLGYSTLGDGGGNIYELKTSGSRPAEYTNIIAHASGSSVLYFEAIYAEGLLLETESGSTYTPALGDQFKKIKNLSHSTTITVTIPNSSSVDFPLASSIIFRQSGDGVIDFVADSGVTLFVPEGVSTKTSGQGAIVQAINIADNVWTFSGGLLQSKLETFLQLSVMDRDLTAPPGSPGEGDCYIPAATATGDWAGQEDKIAQYVNDEWVFYTPATNWLSGVDDEGIIIRYNGSAWEELVPNASGSWTPTFYALTSGSGTLATLSTADGWYKKVGDMVFAGFQITSSSTSGLSGQLAIGIDDIPYTASLGPGVSGRTPAIIPFWTGLSLPSGTINMYGWIQDAAKIRLYRHAITAGSATVTHSEISGNVNMYCTFSFKV